MDSSNESMREHEKDKELRKMLQELDQSKENLNRIAKDLLKIQHQLELMLFNFSGKTFL